eukprot:scpid74978/ scgid17061/ Chromatin assembly factor 1 subunit B; Chromatin assembly factor I p60 subunit
MIIDTLEISWHDRKPVMSVDFQVFSEWTRLATGGADNEIRIWKTSVSEQGRSQVEFLASLARHSGAVNVVRFSPCGEFLASAGDDASIILWKLGEGRSPTFGAQQEDEQKEHWVHHKMMRRGHREDVYDLSWARDSATLLSASIDNTAILWDVSKGEPLKCFSDAQHYVQGVSVDPLGDFLVTMSSDRCLRIFGAKSYKRMFEVSKQPQPITSAPASPSAPASKPPKLFSEGTNTFFRRLAFSPDGALLVVPCGRYEGGNTTFIFARNNLSRPAAHLPGPQKSTIAVSFCPNLLQLRPQKRPASEDNQLQAISLPYRMVFAVASLESVVLYDTQELTAIAAFSSMHYAPLTDISWSACGLFLAMSSTDGYCSVIRFEQGELGEPYSEPTEQSVS